MTRPRGAAGWLALAATPTFAGMAFLSSGHGPALADAVCSASPHASQWTGMFAMYTLMSAFHSAPWLRLLRRRTADAGQAVT